MSAIDLDAIKTEVKVMGERQEASANLTLAGQRRAIRAHAKLESKHAKLAAKVDRLTGAASVIMGAFTVMAMLFAVLGAMSGYSFVQYRAQEAAQKESYDLLVTQFEGKIADTIDRISFLDPTPEHGHKVSEMSDMHKALKDLKVDSVRFLARSDLADAVRLVVTGNQNQEALDKLKKMGLQKDRFVDARVLTLEAILLIRMLPGRDCSNSKVESNVKTALSLDNSVGAAYNIQGTCLARKSRKAFTEAELLDRVKMLENALSFYELGYLQKPTAVTRARATNNAVYGYLALLYPALGLHKSTDDVDKILRDSLNFDFEAFVGDSRRKLALCQELAPELKSIYLETEAELHGLRYAYYKAGNNTTGVQNALKDQREAYKEAIKNGLFRKAPSYEFARDSLKEDELMEPLHNDEEIDKLMKEAIIRR